MVNIQIKLKQYYSSTFIEKTNKIKYNKEANTFTFTFT